MKTFFLMPQRLHCDSNCNFRCCPHKYLYSLQAQSALPSIEILDGFGDCATRKPELLPQHGDIVIMFAGDANDLDQMIGLEDCFECTRNILVLADNEEIDTSRCHQLAPRFITRMDRNIDELQAVISRMQEKTARTQRTMGMEL